MSTVYIQRDQAVRQTRLNNNTGAALAQFELTVINGVILVALDAIANGSVGSFGIVEDISFQVEDFVTSEDTFATVDASVYWDPTSGDFSDTATAGYYKIGIVQEIKNSNGVVLVYGNRDAVILGEVIGAGRIGWIEYEVAADATTALSNDFGFNFTIIDALVHSTATNASATIKLQDSSDNDISDAIVATPVLTVTRVGTIDGETNGYNTIVDGIVKFIANGAADRGIVRMMVKGA